MPWYMSGLTVNAHATVAYNFEFKGVPPVFKMGEETGVSGTLAKIYYFLLIHYHFTVVQK